jgi:hypothetical protein
MKMKTKILAGALALAVMVPGAAFAATTGTGANEHAQNGKVGTHHRHQQMSPEKMKERQEKFMETVNKYAPDLADDFKNAFAERKELKEQLKSRHDAMKQKIDAIREDVKNGKITKEQAKNELDKLGFKKERANKAKRDFSLHKQFKQAVDAKDEAKIKELLPQLLTDLQQKNQALRDKLANNQQ